MTMPKALHSRYDVDRLYVSRKEWGRGLTSIQDHVDTSTQRLKDYMEKRKGRLITATGNNTDDTKISKPEITRKQKWEAKQFCGRFKRLTSDISREKTWMLLKKRNLMRETESLLIAVQNKAIRTNYMKATIDKTQQNRRYRLCSDRDETINHIISECSKFTQKEYKTRHDWWARWSTRNCARNLNLTIRKMVYAQPSSCPGERDKLLWDFQIQTGHLISTRRPELIIINKKKTTSRIVDFAVSADQRVMLKESEKKDKYLDLARESKKTVEHECNGFTNCNWCSCYSHQRIDKRTWDSSNYIIVEIV